MRDLDAIAGAVTAVTGFEKGSGKTTLLNWLIPQVRPAGGVAVFTIGVDGALKHREAGVPVPEIRVEPGDVVMTTESFARAASARLEILDTVPGRTTLGRLLLGRTVRAGSVTLVGCEHFSALSETVRKVRAEGWAASVLVDGAVNRLTQVGALEDVRFLYTARVQPSNLARVAARMKGLLALADLVQDPDPAALRVEGPLTAEGLKTLPSGVQALSLEDFTKVFLEPEELMRLLDRCTVSVRRRISLLGLAVVLKDVSRATFQQALGPSGEGRVLFNPYAVTA